MVQLFVTMQRVKNNGTKPTLKNGFPSSKHLDKLLYVDPMTTTFTSTTIWAILMVFSRDTPPLSQQLTSLKMVLTCVQIVATMSYFSGMQQNQNKILLVDQTLKTLSGKPKVAS
jgi:hypothetical protein